MKKKLLAFVSVLLCAVMLCSAVATALPAMKAVSYGITTPTTGESVTTQDLAAADTYAGSLSYTPSSNGANMTISYQVNGQTVSYTVPNKNNYLFGGYAGTDDLGRKLYTSADVGTVSTSQTRYVGLFYFLLHGMHGSTSKIYNLQQIIDTYPASTYQNANSGLYGPTNDDMHWFAEPLYGYYTSGDEWVMRKHAELLCNANIDFLYFDATNSFTYYTSAITLMSILSELNAQGYDAPQVVFYTNSSSATAVQEVYNNIYSKNLYRDTWFCINGKPVIVATEDTNANYGRQNNTALSSTLKNFFYFKESQWPTETNKTNGWPWMDFNKYPKVLTGSDGLDAINVSIAQHNGNSLMSASAMYGYSGNRGRSYSPKLYSSASAYRAAFDANKSLAYAGANFQAQFDNAISSSAEFVLVTGWNEWVAQRQPSTSYYGVMFVDCASVEYSRDAEMMKGGYFDNYYMQLAYNVEKLKGDAPVIVQDARKPISITGAFTQWDDVIVTYTDPKGDAIKRSATGYGSQTYTDSTNRNDIVASKVIHDTTNLYFYVETATSSSGYSGSGSWMQLFVDIDSNAKTGWYGYDYIINHSPTSSTKTNVYKFTGSNNTTYQFENWGTISYKRVGTQLMFAVPQETLGITNYKEINFQFKWADSRNDITTMEQFYTEGDAAPLGRLNYVYQNYIPGVSTDTEPDDNTPDTSVPTKYVIMSLDDGVTQDAKVIEILKKYGITEDFTFFINSGMGGTNLTSQLGLYKPSTGEAVTHIRYTMDQVKTVYAGYDVQVHGLTHNILKGMTASQIKYELGTDASNIAGYTGVAPTGMAYANGDAYWSTTEIPLIINNTNLRYARAITATNSFALPTDFMKWYPTCSFVENASASSKSYGMLDKYLAANCTENMLFHIWGHAYELDDSFVTWAHFEQQIAKIAAAVDSGEVTLVSYTEFYNLFKDQIPSGGTYDESTSNSDGTTPGSNPVSAGSVTMDTSSMASVSSYRFTAKIKSINGVKLTDTFGYRNPNGASDAAKRCPAIIDASSKGISVKNTGNKLSVSGWALVNGGQLGYVYSLDDGVTWKACTEGTLSDATAANQNTAMNGYGTLTSVNLTKGAYSNLAVDLSAYAGQTVSVRFAVVSNDAPTKVCHFLTVNNVAVPAAEVETDPPETEPAGCDHYFSSDDEFEPLYEVVTNATCTKDGVMYYLCELCGERDVDNPVILPATGHNYRVTESVDPTCTEDGYTTYACSNCGDSYMDESLANGHTAGTPVEENRVEATPTTDGSYDVVTYCTVCGGVITRTTVTIPATGEPETDAPVVLPTASIKGASVTLGQALGITYNAEVQNATATPVMKFTVGEGADAMIVEVEGTYNSTNGRYYFELTGVTPQRLGDNILAEVYVNGVLAGSKDSYSIKTNLVSQLGKSTTPEALKTLIYNTFAYGAAAQVVTGHNVDSMINAGYESNAVSYDMGATDGSDQGFAINNTLSSPKISGVSVNFGDVNKIKVQYTGDNATLYVDGVAVKAEIIDGKYTYYTDGIFASELGKVYTFTLKVNGETVSTLTYSVNAYCARQQGKTTDNAKLAIALFNYGMAAKAYIG